MEEQLITLTTYYLFVLKKIVYVHIRHLEGHVKTLERLNANPDGREDAELYFLQTQLEDAKITLKFLDQPSQKGNGWIKDVFEQIVFSTSKHK